jgi:hypothetical protein
MAKNLPKFCQNDCRKNARKYLTQLSFWTSTSFEALLERQSWWNVFLHFWHLSWTSSPGPETLQIWQRAQRLHCQSVVSLAPIESYKKYC